MAPLFVGLVSFVILCSCLYLTNKRGGGGLLLPLLGVVSMVVAVVGIGYAILGAK